MKTIAAGSKIENSARPESTNARNDLMSDSSAIKALTNSPLWYQLRDIAVLGSGGFGTVYSAYHGDLGRKVAIKVLSATSDARYFSRFQREAKALCKVQHKNVVQVYSSGKLEDGRPYIIMEYLEGTTLSELLADNPSLPMERIEKIFGDVVRGVAAIHEAGMIHRDLTPANLMLIPATATEPEYVKVFDFGLVKWLCPPSGAEELTRTLETCGTYAYMSPEICRARPVDERSDVYSLGCLLYFLMTGQPPFLETNGIATMYKHVEVDIGPAYLKSQNPTLISQSAETVLRTCLAKNPADRYKNAEELLRHISNFGRLTRAQDVSRSSNQQSHGKWQVVSVALIVLILPIAIVVLQNRIKPNIDKEKLQIAAADTDIEQASKKLKELSVRIDLSAKGTQRLPKQETDSICKHLFDLHMLKARRILDKYKLRDEQKTLICKKIMVSEYLSALALAHDHTQMSTALQSLSDWCEPEGELNGRERWAKQFFLPLMEETSGEPDKMLQYYNIVCGRAKAQRLTLAEMCADLKSTPASEETVVSIMHLIDAAIRKKDLSSAEQIYRCFESEYWSSNLSPSVARFREIQSVCLANMARESENSSLFLHIAKHLLPIIARSPDPPKPFIQTFICYSRELLHHLYIQHKTSEENYWANVILESMDSCPLLKSVDVKQRLLSDINEDSSLHKDNGRIIAYYELFANHYKKTGNFNDEVSLLGWNIEVLEMIKYYDGLKRESERIVAMKDRLNTIEGLAAVYLAEAALRPGQEHAADLTKLCNAIRASTSHSRQLDNRTVHLLAVTISATNRLHDPSSRDLRQACMAISDRQLGTLEQAPTMLETLWAAFVVQNDAIQAGLCRDRLVNTAERMTNDMPDEYQQRLLYETAHLLASDKQYQRALLYAHKLVEFAKKTNNPSLLQNGERVEQHILAHEPF